MRTMSPALKNHFAQPETTTCILWKITRKDGLVAGYTNFNKNIEYEGITFVASVGFNASAMQKTSNLSVDNFELKGPLGNVPTTVSDVDLTEVAMLTEADIDAGIWDDAFIEILEVNYEDLSMGDFEHDSGYIGNITTGRNTYTAEARGKTQALQQETGREVTPGCTASLGDKNCRVNIAQYSFTGSVTKTIEQHSWIDTSLNQTNSTYKKTVTAITKANPIRVTSSAHGLSSGERVTFTDIGGMTQLNGMTGIVTYINSTSFYVNIDGTNFSTFTNGGSVTRAVVSEYFKDGKLTWLTGKNKGVVADIKTYRPNYIHLHDAMVFPIEVGDTYTIVAGCDKLISTCHQRFNNVINFYGFNLVPGTARIMSGT